MGIVYFFYSNLTVYFIEFLFIWNFIYLIIWIFIYLNFYLFDYLNLFIYLFLHLFEFWFFFFGTFSNLSKQKNDFHTIWLDILNYYELFVGFDLRTAFYFLIFCEHTFDIQNVHLPPNEKQLSIQTNLHHPTIIWLFCHCSRHFQLIGCHQIGPTRICKKLRFLIASLISCVLW